MPLVPLRPLMEAAETHNYAQGAFNVNAVAQAKAVIEMHETFRSPAILQGADLANAFMGGRVDFANGTLEDKKKGARNIANAVKKYGENSPIPIVLHLDHGKDFDSCVAAIDGGYTSVMIDGSSLPLDQNIELTREVVKYAHARGVSVEGELGVLGGQEDHVFAATSTYTNPLDAVKFIQDTGVDALAISYGTQHGANKGKNDLGGDIQNAYGINVDELIAAIPCGIRKINVDTDIRLAVTRNMKELFAQQPELQKSASIGGVYALLEEKKSAFDPRVFFPPIMDTILTGNVPDKDVALLMSRVEAGVKEAVGSLIVNFGSYGKAPLVEQKSLEDMIAFYKK